MYTVIWFRPRMISANLLRIRKSIVGLW